MLVEKVNYDIDIKAFKRGTSVFIPCLDCESVRSQLTAYFKKFRIKTVAKVTIEQGIRGCRVWRT
jgi:hypothetical protein